MATDPKNKVVVITGAAEGIGFGIAEKFLAKQAKVVLFYLISMKKRESNLRRN